MARAAATPTRRDQILASAGRLFADRGFHGVSIDQIGASVGITGPALYKHFNGKEALLGELLVGCSRGLLAGARKRSAELDDPRAALRSLVEFHVDFALTQPELIVVQERDWTHLRGDDRATVRRLQRSYVDRWAEVLTAVQPGLTREVARAAVQAAFGLMNSTPHSATRLPLEQMRPLLARLALAALTGAVDSPERCRREPPSGAAGRAAVNLRLPAVPALDDLASRRWTCPPPC